MTYLVRAIDSDLDELREQAPAVAIDGPKGVGKTDTAWRRANHVWLLDDPAQRRLAEADFQFASVPTGTLLIDEWQQAPSVWDAVRRSVDAGAVPGRFLLTGSATPRDARGTHSGAGRIISLRMRPMALFERGITSPTVSLKEALSGTLGTPSGTSTFTLPDYASAIVASGFPGIMSLAPRVRGLQLDGYLQRVIDRDLPDEGFEVRRPEVLRRWLAAYAAASSQTTSYSKLLDQTTSGDGSQPAATTTIAYREHLERLWLLDPVPGWLPAINPIKRLQQAPKHQLADPALAARLLDQTEMTLTSHVGAHLMGPLFESLATLSVRVAAQSADARVFHLRSNGGEREIDLIVEGADGRVLAIEVKLARAVDDRDVRHLLWLRDKVPDRIVDLMVLSTGPAAYRRSDGVAVVPLALLGA